MKDQLIFDTTDASTIADSDSVGAFVRSDDGTLITHTVCTPDVKASFIFVDGDVTIGTDSIAEIAHGLETGDKVQLTSTGTLPAGLALATDYYIIRVDADNFKLAASEASAKNGIAVNITAAAGGGNHTVNPQEVTKQALDVSLCTPFPVHYEDAAHASGDQGFMSLAVRNDNEGSLVDIDGDYAPLQVDATGRLRVVADLEITNSAEKTEDSAHASGDIGNFVLGIRMDDVDGANSALLAGIEGDYQGMFTNAKGELHVRDNDVYDQLVITDAVIDNIDSTLTILSKAEDSVHVSGDQGIMGLAVRNDAGVPLAANGDYVPFMVNENGALYTDPEDSAIANSSIANAANTLGVADTAESVVAAPLASRKYLWIYNKHNTKVFVGATGVSAADGFPISPGSYLELRAGASVGIEFVGQTGKTPEIRTLELS